MKSTIPAALLGLAALAGDASAATSADLAHRWSFNDTSDSVGGATLTLVGTATTTGVLNLPGGGARTNYASAPIGATIGSASSLTVETWFTMGSTNGNWSKAWMFGTANSTNSYMDFTPKSGDATQISASEKSPATLEVNTRNNPTSPTIAANTAYLGTVVYDTGNTLMSLYLSTTGGAPVLVGSKAWFGVVSDLGNTNSNFIGAAVGFGDNDFIGSVDEMRIWKTAFTPAEVAKDAAAGPNVVGVPEPSALLISCLGGFALLRRRRA